MTEPATGESERPAPTERPAPAERRVGVIWDETLVDSAGAWPEQLGLDTCGECDVDDPADLY